MKKKLSIEEQYVLNYGRLYPTGYIYKSTIVAGKRYLIFSN